MENSLLQSAYRKGKYSEIAKGEKKNKKKKRVSSTHMKTPGATSKRGEISL